MARPPRTRNGPARGSARESPARPPTPPPSPPDAPPGTRTAKSRPDPRIGPEPAALGARIRALRVRRGWSQADLAKASGVKADYVSKHEQGQQAMQYETMLTYANAFETTVEKLLAGLPLRESATARNDASSRATVLANEIPHAASTPPARHNLPLPRSGSFVGRGDELAELRRVLASDDGATKRARRVALVGDPGIGKSHLALEYAYANLATYGTVLWVNAAGAAATDDFIALGELIGLTALTGGTERKVRRVRDAIEKLERALLVLDNIDDAKTLLDLVPRIGSIHVIATTRERLGVGFFEIDVGPLEHEIAIDFVLTDRRRWKSADVVDASALCDELGRLTLALDCARCTLSFGVNRPKAVLNELVRSGAVRWSQDMALDSLHGKSTSLYTLFDSSYRRLDTARFVDRRARSILGVAGWYAPVAIDPALLLAAAARTDRAKLDPVRDTHALERLVSLGLARADERGWPLFHRLVQDYARTIGGPGSLTAVLDTWLDRLPVKGDETTALLALRPWRRHLEHVAAHVHAPVAERHLRVFLRLCQHLNEAAEYEGVPALCEKALTFTRKPAQRSYFLHTAARAEIGRGNFARAAELFNEDRKMTRAARAPDGDMAMTLNGLGQAQAAMGRFDDAIKTYEDALKLAKRAEARWTEASISYDLGTALLARGENRRALDLFRESLQGMRAELSEDHPDVAVSMHGVGLALVRGGDVEEGLRILHEALTARRRGFGSHHPLVAETLNAIADAVDHEGPTAEGIGHRVDALAILVESLGERHHETTAAVSRLAEAADRWIATGPSTVAVAGVLDTLTAKVINLHDLDDAASSDAIVNVRKTLANAATAHGR